MSFYLTIKLENVISSANWDEILTVILAAWGAILSTIIFMNDRPRVKVGIEHGYLIDPNGSFESLKILSFSVRNFGRRPVIIHNIHFLTDQRGNEVLLIMPEKYINWTLPKKLTENGILTLHIDYEFIKKQCIKKKLNINFVVFTDSLGKKFKAKISKKKFPDLKKNINKNFLLRIYDYIVFR